MTISTRGRPAATSHAEIEQAAFELFAEHGFEATTVNAIAERIGVSPRTISRYYPAKNDIPWGQFDRTLSEFRSLLAEIPRHLPLWERVHRGVVAFNDFPADAVPSHRDRMEMILNTPALEAHSVLRYQQWRTVIAEYVAAETGQSCDSLVPRIAGFISLSITMSAYEQWLLEGSDDTASLHLILDQSAQALRAYLA